MKDSIVGLLIILFKTFTALIEWHLYKSIFWSFLSFVLSPFFWLFWLFQKTLAGGVITEVYEEYIAILF